MFNIRVRFDWANYKGGRALVTLEQVIVRMDPKTKKESQSVQLIDQEAVRTSPLFMKFRLNRAMKRIKKRQDRVAQFLEAQRDDFQKQQQAAQSKALAVAES